MVVCPWQLTVQGVLVYACLVDIFLVPLHRALVTDIKVEVKIGLDFVRPVLKRHLVSDVAVQVVTSGVYHVWSLTKFYTVVFLSASRKSVKQRVSAHMTVSLFLCSSGSNAQE